MAQRARLKKPSGSESKRKAAQTGEQSGPNPSVSSGQQKAVPRAREPQPLPKT
jgi:hypothetical protein